jgi:uncharacterized membrane protein YqgA involved in biofilm formation
MKISNKTYDIMKWIMLLATPLCTFILGIIAAIQTGDVAAIITAVLGGIGTLAGTIIKISDTTYRKEQNNG